MVGGADEAFLLHPLDQRGGAVVADLQPALDIAGRGLAVAGDDGDGAVFDSTGMGGGEGADLFTQAVAIVKRDRKASTSYIQRRLQIGYNRAASLMERMELEGIVGQANHAGKREILVEEEEGRF